MELLLPYCNNGGVDETSKTEATEGISEDLQTNPASTSSPEINLADAIQRRFAPLGGIELTLPSRETVCQSPEFE